MHMSSQSSQSNKNLKVTSVVFKLITASKQQHNLDSRKRLILEFITFYQNA